MKGDQPTSAGGLGSAGRPSTILVLGLGNPILGDDGAGWRVAEAIQAHFGPQERAVEVDCASLGGLSLMERVLGYGRVILIDVMETGQHRVGYVSRFPLDALSNPTAGHTGSAHDASLVTALDSARALGAEVPERIEIIAIEAQQTYAFSEDLSPPVRDAVPVATRMAIEAILQAD